VPILFEVDDFDSFVAVLKQLRSGKRPDCQVVWPAPVRLVNTTSDHIPVAVQHSQAEPSAGLVTTTSVQPPVAAKKIPCAAIRAFEAAQPQPLARTLGGVE
jgi:hypothetical protein